MTVEPRFFLQRTERAQFLVDNLNLPKASGVEDAVWEEFQLDHLNDDSIFGIRNKSRQIANSFLFAAEAVADAILEKRDSIFSSINKEEAKEKIRYAKAVYENLEIGGLPKLKFENQLNLEFETGVRLTSFPARPVRGRPKSNWYGDEFAHIQRVREIYRGSLPIMSKGGRIRIGSSPLGASDLFWEICTDVKQYPHYSRKTTPWWEVQAFCKNVQLAINLAPKLNTSERVEFFGKDRIKALFSNMPVEDFQQEFECHLAETLVKLANGTDKEVFQLDIGDMLVYNCNGIMKECEVITMKKTGIKEIIQITTESGTELKASVGHKVKTSVGKTLIEKANDLTYVFTRNFDKSKKAALARIIAYNLGDGTIAERREKYIRKDGTESIYKPYFQASFYSKSKDDLEFIAEDIVNSGLSDRKPNVLFKKGSRKEFDSHQLHLSRKPVDKLIKNGCVVGKKTLVDFEVPEWIKASDISIKSEFLASLWGAEGTTPTISYEKRNKVCKVPRLTMWWKRKGLGDNFFADLQKLHLDCGVETSLSKSGSGENYRYNLYVKSGVENFIKFFDKIGYRYALGKERLSFLWKFYLRAYRFEPQERKRQVVQMKNQGSSFSAIGKEIGLTAQAAHSIYHREIPKKPSTSFPTFDEWVKPRFENNILSLKVASIEVLPEQPVYNITVDSPDHSYLLADGLDNYNCAFVDESTAWITYKEIKANQSVDQNGDDECLHVKASARNSEIDEVLAAIDDFCELIRENKIEHAFGIGVDIGRTRHATEISANGLGQFGRFPLRLQLTLNNCDFDSQEAVLRKLFNQVPFVGAEIDREGIGRQLAERMSQEYPFKVISSQFTNETKKVWATDLKMLFSKRQIPIPINRDLENQIHSIKKIISPSKNLIFDTERNEKHHADKFWSLALSVSAARRVWLIDDSEPIGSVSFNP